MGTNYSSQVQENIIKNTTVNSSSIIQDISQQNAQSLGINQSITLRLEPGAALTCDGNLELLNEGETSQSGISRLDAQQISDITSKIAEDFAQAAVTELEQANSEFNFLQLNIADVVNNAITETETENKVKVEQAIFSTVTQSSSIQQAIEVIISENAAVSVSGDCVFNNTATVDMTSENAVTAFMDSVLTSETAKSVVQDLDTAVEQSNKGVNLTLIIIIVVVVIVVIIAIALGVKYGMAAA